MNIATVPATPEFPRESGSMPVPVVPSLMNAPRSVRSLASAARTRAAEFRGLCVRANGVLARWAALVLPSVSRPEAATRSLADGYAHMAANAMARGQVDQAAMYEQASRALASTTTGDWGSPGVSTFPAGSPQSPRPRSVLPA